jgi:hypothetical protein
VDFIASPDPDPEAREAIALALEGLLRFDETPPAYRSRWRAEGVVENLDGDDDEPPRQNAAAQG